MNVNTLQTVLVLLLFSCGSAATAQGGANFSSDNSLAIVDSHTKTVSKTAPLTSTSARNHKRFPQLHTGLAIEIATSTYPMDKTSPVFRQFGNVYYEKLPEGGYSYLIMANFSSKESALEFVQNVMKPKAENARLIQYSEGNRKVIRE